MSDALEQLYIRLMRDVLSFSLWPEPPAPIVSIDVRRPLLKRFLTSLLSAALARRSLVLCREKPAAPDRVEEGRYWPAYADTMIGLGRLDNIQFCVETVLAENVKGDFIETGVWRGGACIFMRAILAARGVTDRRVFVADSFQGLPKPNPAKYPADRDDVHYAQPSLAVAQSEVERNFRKYGLLDDQVVFLIGFFADTLPSAPVEDIAVLRLDGDMYGSTMEALEALYPKLSIGGFCIVDDYALEGCRLAVDEYRQRNGIDHEILRIDWTGVYWRKL